MYPTSYLEHVGSDLKNRGQKRHGIRGNGQNLTRHHFVSPGIVANLLLIQYENLLHVYTTPIIYRGQVVYLLRSPKYVFQDWQLIL